MVLKDLNTLTIPTNLLSKFNKIVRAFIPQNMDSVLISTVQGRLSRK